MKAFIKKMYGGPEILKLGTTELDSLKPHEIRIRIKANSVNPADWHILRGKPYFSRLIYGLITPKYPIPGADFAGIVEETGSACKRFKTGDHVVGTSLIGGAFAEYIHIDENNCTPAPGGSSLTELACLPIAGLTALQATQLHGNIQSGERVLINGSSGGVGHFCVQLAKNRGASVTAICSSKNKHFVESLGADEVLAYDKTNIHTHGGKYDLVIDTHGNLNFSDFKRMGQRGVLTGFTGIGHLISVMLLSKINSFPLAQFTAEINAKDLAKLVMLCSNGQLKVHMEQVFPFEEIPNAIERLEQMHTRGKLAIVW